MEDVETKIYAVPLIELDPTDVRVLERAIEDKARELPDFKDAEFIVFLRNFYADKARTVFGGVGGLALLDAEGQYEVYELSFLYTNDKLRVFVRL